MGFIFTPGLNALLHGLSLDAGGIDMTRQLEVVFLMLGIILWLANKDLKNASLTPIYIGLFVGTIVGAMVVQMGQFTAPVSFLGYLFN